MIIKEQLFQSFWQLVKAFSFQFLHVTSCYASHLRHELRRRAVILSWLAYFYHEDQFLLSDLSMGQRSDSSDKGFCSLFVIWMLMNAMNDVTDDG